MVNKPTCLSNGHPGIDPGTLNRNRTNPPGPTVNESGGSFSLLRDGAAWENDRASLYATLIKEGLGFLVDVYGDKPGGGAAPIAEAWDQRIKNMANAHNTFSRDHNVGAMLPFDWLAQWFADTDPMKRKLLDHYISGQGADFNLTLEQMKLMPTYIDLFQTNAYSPNLSASIDEAKKGRLIQVQTEVIGQNDALGNFTIHLRGVLKPAKGSPSGSTDNPYSNGLSPVDPGTPLMFEGTMNWTDYWDFDPKVAMRLKKGTGRGAAAEAAVNAVAALVDGVPFQVTSVTVPMSQYSGRFPVY